MTCGSVLDTLPRKHTGSPGQPLKPGMDTVHTRHSLALCALVPELMNTKSNSSQARRRQRRWAARQGNAIAARMTAGISLAKAGDHLPTTKSKYHTRAHNPPLRGEERRGLTTTSAVWRCRADII